MTRLLYNLLWPLGLALFLPRYVAKMVRRGGYRKNFGERFAFYSAETRKRLRGKQPTWIHAVSVGEVIIASRLAGELRALRPDLNCVLTTTTTTGHALATKSSPGWMQVLYAPLDFWPVMRRAFRVIAPERVILIEAEVWPNLVAEGRKRKVPLMLASARLSPRSERRFGRFRFFVAPMFQQLDLVCVPSPEDAERWKRLGIVSSRIHAVGNIKYDVSDSPPPSGELQQLIAAAVHARRPILFGGSTHQGEENILADVFSALRTEFPELLLVLAPRHVERAAEIEADLRSRNLSSIRRSRLPARGAWPQCLLIDTTGELRNWYNIATIVFIGKSLTAHGGQNPVEPISAGKPVLFGPHMENFASLASQLIAEGGATCVQTPQELIEASRHLLRDASARGRMVKNAVGVIQAHRGATARTALLIEKSPAVADEQRQQSKHESRT